MTLRVMLERKIFILSILLAFLVMLLPWPTGWFHILPAWMFVVLCYWSLYYPMRVSLWVCWFLGLFVDVAEASLLGQHAFVFVLFIYILQKLQRQIHLFPQHQQIAVIIGMVFLHQLMIAWIHGITGQSYSASAIYWVPLTSAVYWLGIKVVLDHYLLNYGDQLHHRLR